MRLDGVWIGAPTGSLAALGLSAPDDRALVGGVTLATTEGARDGLVALDLDGVPDGPLPLADVEPAAPPADPHPLGATAVDHVVVLAGDVLATIEALGTTPRRVDERDGRRYAFVVADTALLEFVGPVEPEDRPARLWGLALTVADLDAAAALLGAACGDVKPAVQPGRRIATVRHDRLGFTVPTVLLTPRP